MKEESLRPKDTLYLLGEIEKKYTIKVPRVREAFIRVPRHSFLSFYTGEETNSLRDKDANYYDDVAWPVKASPEGLPLSSSTQPTLMAMMLDALKIPEGGRILEIGAGTGYNAALMAYISGAGGLVVSMDIEEDVLANARKGVSGMQPPCPVHLFVRDASEGVPEFAPYDRIICTAATSTIPKTWIDQLQPSGQMLIPLLFKGMNFLSLLSKMDSLHLSGKIVAPCGFMSLRGPLYDETHQPIAISNLPLFLSRCDAQPLPASMVGDFSNQWNFAFWLALQDPLFRVLIERTPHPLPEFSRIYAYSLYISNDRFAAYQGDKIYFLEPSLARALLKWYTKWEAEDKPDLKDITLHYSSDAGPVFNFLRRA